MKEIGRIRVPGNKSHGVDISKDLMENFELIINIKGVKFYKGVTVDTGEKVERIIMTDRESYRVDVDEDLLKACGRIYKLWYE